MSMTPSPSTSLLVTSPSLATKPAVGRPSTVSGIRSLSLSRSRKSGTLSPSLSTGTDPTEAAPEGSVVSASKISINPSPSASATPPLAAAASASEIVPSPSVSAAITAAEAPLSYRSLMPSLSLSRSQWLATVSQSESAIERNSEKLLLKFGEFVVTACRAVAGVCEIHCCDCAPSPVPVPSPVTIN